MIQINRAFNRSYILNAVIFDTKYRRHIYRMWAPYYIDYMDDLAELVK